MTYRPDSVQRAFSDSKLDKPAQDCTETTFLPPVPLLVATDHRVSIALQPTVRKKMKKTLLFYSFL